MKYFERFVSNTIAGSGNQKHFSTDGEVCTGRVFYKITVGGEYHYSILFSNIIDSTYGAGEECHKNYICDSWQIHGARVGRAADMPVGDAVMELEDATAADFHTLTFGGSEEKEVMPGEFFTTDPLLLSFEKGEYLCLEITFSGRTVPYHDESMIPVYRKTNNGWEYNRKTPLPGMIGCDRKVKERIVYMGDSITQGIGPDINSYEHWNARLSQKLGEEYAFWNLGLGFGRANDAASDGAWLFKAKQSDTVVVCYGVNDILQGFSAKQIKRDLTTIVDTLQTEGKRVLLQTVPPFDYEGEEIGVWEEVNRFIKSILSHRVDLVFDVVPHLCDSEEKPYGAQKYGGHPNAAGCTVWADAFYEEIQHLF